MSGQVKLLNLGSSVLALAQSVASLRDAVHELSQGVSLPPDKKNKVAEEMQSVYASLNDFLARIHKYQEEDFDAS